MDEHVERLMDGRCGGLEIGGGGQVKWWSVERMMRAWVLT